MLTCNVILTISYSRMCDFSSWLAPPLGHTDGRMRRGQCTGTTSVGRSCTLHWDTDACTALCPPRHDTPARDTSASPLEDLPKVMTQTTLTWNTELWITEHTLSAYCLRWVYVPQGSEVIAEGRGHEPVRNLAAKEETLFSTSPSGVVKSSCWLQVRVPHNPRTWHHNKRSHEQTVCY